MYLIQSAGDAPSQRPSEPTQNMRAPQLLTHESAILKFDAYRAHAFYFIRYRTLSASHTPTSPEKACVAVGGAHYAHAFP